LSEEFPCKTGGIHTRPAPICRPHLKAPLRKVDRQDMNV
jgi:hypothetical protein